MTLTLKADILADSEEDVDANSEADLACSSDALLALTQTCDADSEADVLILMRLLMLAQMKHAVLRRLC